jgi:YkoY family integral membrane protein
LSVAPGDFLVVGTLVVLEGLLSADNALVLALLVKHLPDKEQKRALLYGLIGAFVLRGTAIYFARYLMNLWWMCGVGALYLMGLAIRHFFLHSRPKEDEDAEKKAAGLGFWPTVVQVELTDLIFAIDSILVAVAMVHKPDKIWVIYAGGFMGILLLRLAASFFIKLITKYPALDHLAYGLVGWAGIKLASASADIFAESKGLHEPHYLPTWAFWTGFAVITAAGTVYALRQGRRPEDQEQCDEAEDALDCLETGGFIMEPLPPPGPPVASKRK